MSKKKQLTPIMSKEKQLTSMQQILLAYSNAIESKESLDQKIKMNTTNFI